MPDGTNHAALQYNGHHCKVRVRNLVKKRISESQINAELRRLTDEVRQLREDLRGSLKDRKRSLAKVLDEPHAKPASRRRDDPAG